MRRIVFAALVSLATAVSAAPAQAAAVQVRIDYASFTPPAVDALPGDTVTWSNHGGRTHTVTSDTYVWNSGSVFNGRTFSFKFNTLGTYAYHCSIHPEMLGVVHVRRVTLGPLPSSAVAGGTRVVLAGRTADTTSPVQIEQDTGSGFKRVATASPGPDGSWKAQVVATKTAHYRAALGSDLSETRRLLVIDRRVNVRRTRGGITVHVVPRAPHARLALELYRRNRFGWWRTRRTRLDADSRTRFALRGPARARVVLLGKDGWTALATSRVIRIRAR